MGGIVNGIAYHGGLHPVRGTFLTFSDYMRGCVRLAALSGLPRHLRLDPRLGGARRGRADPPAGRALRGAAGDPEPVVRPARRRERDRRRLGARRRADASGPVALALTRQKLPTLPGTAELRPRGRRRGGYVAARGVHRGGRRHARPHPHRHRLRAPARRRRRRGARGRGDRRPASSSLPCWERVRGPGRRLPRGGPAAGGPATRHRRGRRLARLGALGRRRGRDRRPRPLRRVGPGRHDLRRSSASPPSASTDVGRDVSSATVFAAGSASRPGRPRHAAVRLAGADARHRPGHSDVPDGGSAVVPCLRRPRCASPSPPTTPAPT